MSRELLADLLQECLAAYDAGVAPEDCLSAYPTRRQELEPLFRQALSLRISFAASPEPEFRERAKEALMFAAGREVAHAFSARPDREFVKDARAKFMHAAGAQAQEALRAVPNPDPRYVARSRRRFIYAAGADAQEALRAVPPPRLPFWWNTRRNLLEAAAAKNLPQPRPMPVRRPFGSLAFQAGLSVAVVVLAITAGAATYLTNQPATPSASAQVDDIERQLQNIEARGQAGEVVSPVEVVSLAQKTTELAEKVKEQPSSPAAAKLSSLIEQQQNIIANAPQSPEVVKAQQNLTTAAASVQPSPAAALAAATSTAVPPTATAAAPTATATSTPIPAPLQPGQVRIGLLANDTFAGMTWQEIRTANARFIAPSSWQVANVASDANGVARLVGNSVGLAGSDPVPVIVVADVEGATAGQIIAVVNGQTMLLRTSDGRFISTEDLVAKAAPVALQLRHLLESFDITPAISNNTALPPIPPPPPPLPVATSTPTQTPAPSVTVTHTPTTTPATSTPAATATPKPASPTATPTAKP